MKNVGDLGGGCSLQVPPPRKGGTEKTPCVAESWEIGLEAKNNVDGLV